MTIAARQNEPHSLDLLGAQRQLYTEAKTAWHLRMLGSVGIAAAAPMVALLWPSAGPILAAIAAFWLIVSRVILRPMERARNDRGAAIQEEFDTYVYDMAWNTAKAQRVEPQMTAAAARRHFKRNSAQRRTDVENWYADPKTVHVPYNVLMCQQANLSWSARLHREWTTAIAVTFVAWVAVGIAVSVWKDLSLGEYLVGVLVPMAPALVDVVDTWEQHRGHTQHRAAAELRARTAWNEGITNAVPVSMDHCRHIQDLIFDERREPLWVADWFYNLRKDPYEADMQAAAKALIDDAARHGHA